MNRSHLVSPVSFNVDCAAVSAMIRITSKISTDNQKRCVMYFVSDDSSAEPTCDYIESYFPEQVVSAFAAIGIDAFIVPVFLTTQAI